MSDVSATDSSESVISARLQDSSVFSILSIPDGGDTIGYTELERSFDRFLLGRSADTIKNAEHVRFESAIDRFRQTHSSHTERDMHHVVVNRRILFQPVHSTKFPGTLVERL